MEKTIDERADEYCKNTNLDPNTYIGDVQTAYVIACSEQEKEIIDSVKRNFYAVESYALSLQSMVKKAWFDKGTETDEAYKESEHLLKNIERVRNVLKIPQKEYKIDSDFCKSCGGSNCIC